MENIRLILLGFGLFATSCRAITNTNYFTFPSKTDDIPLVHLGDTLNVTWLSDYSQAVMYFWCDSGAKKMGEMRGLGGDGTLSVVVNSSWTSPCHWQYCQQANEAIFVDSGHVRVTNARETPAVTWVPSTLGVACGIQSATVTNNLGQTVTTTIAAAATTTSNAPASSSSTPSSTCVDSEDGPNLSSGASIGVGIAAGLAIAGVTAAVWIPLRRRCLGMNKSNHAQEFIQMPHYQQDPMQPKPTEMDNHTRVEMDTERRLGIWALSELPSTPHKRSP